MIVFRNAPRQKAEDPLAYYKERLDELANVIALAGGDRDLAIFRAHGHGMPVEEIARWSELDPAEVHRAIEAVANDPDLEDLDDTREWIRCYRG